MNEYEDRSCDTCVHEDCDSIMEPCSKCRNYNLWEEA